MARLAQGDLINLSGSRSRLAISYDASAARVITAAIARYGDRKARGDWHTAYVASPAGDPVDRGGRTSHERAFMQAMYYDARIYRHGDPYYLYNDEGDRYENPNPRRTHALRVKWGRVTVRGRECMVRVYPVGEASLYAEQRYG